MPNVSTHHITSVGGLNILSILQMCKLRIEGLRGSLKVRQLLSGGWNSNPGHLNQKRTPVFTQLSAECMWFFWFGLLWSCSIFPLSGPSYEPDDISQSPNLLGGSHKVLCWSWLTPAHARGDVFPHLPADRYKVGSVQ